MHVGGRIRELRLKRELTQSRLALLLDVEPRAVSRWETNLSLPSALNRYKLARVFEVSPDVFLPTVDAEEKVA
jgi:transcriptional regulator with XRE-family HTH domain